jgi:hypothetical protein
LLALTSGDAASVCRLLRQLCDGAGVPPRIRDAARYWADEMGTNMPPEAVQTVAWLLQDAGRYRGVPSERRDEARYWAAFLDGIR